MRRALLALLLLAWPTVVLGQLPVGTLLNGCQWTGTRWACPSGLPNQTSGAAPLGASYVVLGLEALLTNEHVLTGGADVTVTTAPTTATLGLSATGVSAGTYGDGTHVGAFTVDARGRLTVASNVAITGAPPSGAAGGDLTGTFPNPTLVAILSAGGPTGDATHVPQITFDAKGRLTAVSSVLITGTAPGGSAGGDLTGTYPSPTVAKVNAVAYPASPSTNTVPVVTGANTVTYEAVPNAALANSTVTYTGAHGLTSPGSVALGATVAYDISAGGIANDRLANSSVTVAAGSSTGLTVSGSPVSLGGTVTVGATTDLRRMGSLGLGIAPSSTTGTIKTQLGANAINGIEMRRFTDTSPTGYFLMTYDTGGGTPMFSVDVSGNVADGTWKGSKVGLLYGGTNADLSATGGTAQVLMQASAGAAVTVAQLAAANLSNGTTGSGAVVLAAAPTLTGAVTFSGQVGIGVTPAVSFDLQYSSPTLVDLSSWGASTARVATNLNTAGSGVAGSANQFGFMVQTTVTGDTGAAASYEKAAIFGWARTFDPSGATLRDVVGGDFRGSIASGNMTGRAWGANVGAFVESSADGAVQAIETAVTNNATTDQGTVGTSTSKYAVQVVTNGTQNVTAGIYFARTGATTFHKGLYVDPTLLGTDSTDRFLELLNLWSVKPTGVTTITPTLAANTSGDSLILENTATASSGNQMYSPRLRLTGRGWKSDATTASRAVDWIVENQPVQAATNPTTALVTSYQINAGGYAVHHTAKSSGAFDLASGGVYSINATTVLSGTTLGAGVTASSLTSVGTIGTGVWQGTAVAALYGGTGLTSYAVGDLIYASATTPTLAKLAVGGTAGMFVRSTGTLPGWSTLVLPNAATTGDTVIATATNTWGAVTAVAAGAYFRSAGTGTAPVWSTTTLPNSATTGDLLYASAANVYSNLADVAAGSYLRSGGTSTAPVWSTITLPNAVTTGDTLIATGTNAVGVVAASAIGKVPISAGTGTAWTWSAQPALTASTNTLPSNSIAASTVFLQVADDTNNPILLLDSAGRGSNIVGRRSEGTFASPTATASGSTIFSFQARGYQTTTNAYTGALAGVFFISTQAYTSTAQGTKIQFNTVPNGSTTSTNAATIDQDQTFNSVGGYKANGTAGLAASTLTVCKTGACATTCTITVTLGIVTASTC